MTAKLSAREQALVAPGILAQRQNHIDRRQQAETELGQVRTELEALHDQVNLLLTKARDAEAREAKAIENIQELDKFLDDLGIGAQETTQDEVVAVEAPPVKLALVPAPIAAVSEPEPAASAIVAAPSTNKRDRVLEAVKDSPKSIAQIADLTQSEYQPVSALTSSMRRAGMLTRPSPGVYGLAPQGFGLSGQVTDITKEKGQATLDDLVAATGEARHIVDLATAKAEAEGFLRRSQSRKKGQKGTIVYFPA